MGFQKASSAVTRRVRAKGGPECMGDQKQRIGGCGAFAIISKYFAPNRNPLPIQL